MAYLRQVYNVSIDAVKVVHGKRTKAFVTFASQRDAEQFVNKNYPSITMQGLYEDSPSLTVSIDFAAANLPQTTDVRHKNGQIPHDGMRDWGTGTNNCLLLIRQVEQSATANIVTERVAQELARLLQGQLSVPVDPAVAIEGIKRVVHIRDISGWSWGVFFVELVSPSLATALLLFLNDTTNQPSGFRIHTNPVEVSFGAQAAFVATEAGLLGGEGVVQGRTDGVGASTGWVKYWHAQGIAHQYPDTPRALSLAGQALFGHSATSHAQPPPTTTKKAKSKKPRDDDMMMPLQIKPVLEQQVEPDQDTTLRSRSELSEN